MPNVLVVPVSGAIFFDRNVAGASTVAALNSAVRLSYDQGGGLNITSYTAATTALDRFTVDGAQGRLFSVSDALTGSLMSVNDISGLPILEVLDTDTVIAGSYNTNTFIVSGTRIAVGRTIDSTAKVAISGNTTVVGDISASGTVFASGGNSNQWNSTSTVVQQNSGNFVLPAGLEILTNGPSPFGDLFNSFGAAPKNPQSIRLINSQFNSILFDNTFNTPLNISYNGNVYSGNLYLGGIYYSNNASIAGPTFITVKNLNVLLGSVTFNSIFSNGSLGPLNNSGSSTATGPVSTLEFPNLSCVVGSININSCAGLTAISFPELELVDGGSVGGYSTGINIGGGANSQLAPPTTLESVSFPKLKYVTGGSLNIGGYYTVITGATRFREVSVPLLSSVNFISVGNSSHTNTTFYSLTTFNLPSLRDVGSVTFGQVGLSAIQFENLLYMTGQYTLVGNPNLKDIICLNQKTIGGYIMTASSCPKLSGLYFNNLEAIAGGGNSISFSGITTLSALYIGENTLNSVNNIGNSFTCNSVLTQASVDSVLKAFSRLDGTGIRSTFGSGATLTLAGGNRPPSYTGGVTTTSAGTNFTRAGTTVTANVVGHGHTTGNIVTFTGNTATALNGTYAVTVVTPDQFQYTTSTSGAATGGGTVTMRRTTVATDGFRFYQTIALRGVTITINFP